MVSFSFLGVPLRSALTGDAQSSFEAVLAAMMATMTEPGHCHFASIRLRGQDHAASQPATLTSCRHDAASTHVLQPCQLERLSTSMEYGRALKSTDSQSLRDLRSNLAHGRLGCVHCSGLCDIKRASTGWAHMQQLHVACKLPSRRPSSSCNL